MIPVLQREATRTPRSNVPWMRLLALLLLIFASLAAMTGIILKQTSAGAVGDDWSTYLHDPQRSSMSNDTTISTSNAGQLVKDWTFKTGGVIGSSVTEAGGTVYAGSWDGYEYALDATSGTLKWKTYLGQTSVSSCIPPQAGITSTATVFNGVVYVGGGDSYWYALDATTGAVLWKLFTGDNSATGGYYNWSSPLIYNGYAYIGIASFGDCPLVQGQLLQVDLNTHQIVNTFNVVPAGQVGGGIWGSPSVDTTTNTIYVTTGTESNPGQPYSQAIIALDASTLAVKSSWKLPEGQAVTDSDFGTTPTFFNDASGNPLVVSINKNGYAYAFNRSNLAAGPVWSQQIAIGGQCPTCDEGSVSPGTFGNGRLYLAGGQTTINGTGYLGSVRALDPSTGNILWQHGTPGPVFGALVYDNGLVIEAGGPLLEVLDAATGARLYSYTTGNTIYSAPSVANGQIFVGSTDGYVYAFGLSTTPPPTPTPDPSCPSGWSCQDIGNSTPAGSENLASGTWNVQAGGTGVGGTSDQFRFIAQNVSGDTQISAQVVSQQATTGPAQAGLMVRQSSDPTSPYYSVFLTNGVGVVVQYRSNLGGGTITDVQMPTAVPPLYLEIQRIGDQFQAAASNDGTNYTLVPGSTVSVQLTTPVNEGLAVSSDNTGALSTATYNSVAIGAPGTPPAPTPPATPCPNSWNCQDVGNPAIVGDQSLNGGTWTIKGSGSDIWYAYDQFHFVWQSLAADGSIAAHVLSQTNTNDWAKTGVMLRQSTDASSPYYAAFVTPGNGINVQYRSINNLNAKIISAGTGTLPTYLEVVRSSNVYTTYTSSDGKTWTPVSGSSVVLNLNGAILAGLAVSSHNTGAFSTVTFDSVNISTTVPSSACPGGWNCGDIGNPALPGSQIQNGSSLTVQGAGNDIWNASDQFHFVWQSLAADGNIAAHVLSQLNSDGWAKAGVMLRQSTDPGSPYYGILVTPGNGIVIQSRATQGSNTQQLVGFVGTVPAYLMVARSGTTYSTYTSTDGITWTPVAGSSITLNLSGPMLAGLAVSSHNAGTMSAATFDSINISTLACPVGWNCADIGNPIQAGSQSLSGSTWTVQGSGYDIWNASDQFHFVWQSLAADGSASAHILSQTNTSTWAKAGVMLRQSTDPGSPYYFAAMTPGNGITVQYRTAQGSNAQQLVAFAGTVPAYLMVARSGTTYSTYTSSDGKAWTPVGGSSITLNMSGSLLAGLAVSSHNGGVLSAVTLDTVSISTTVPAPPSCPANWSCADIGNPSLAGSQSLSGSTWTVQGAGVDIWNAADQFHFVWQSLAADGSASAHILTQTNTSSWAKAGVMLRQSIDPTSAYYAAFVTPGNGISVQYRTAQGSNAQQLVAFAGAVPAYLMVARSGTTYSTYTSSDGITWTPVAKSSITLNMSGSTLAGLAVSSHNSGTLSTVTFDTVNVGPLTCPLGWNCKDIGNVALAGSQSLSGSTWTVQGAGVDIWNAADQFHFVWQSLAADGSASAHILTQTNTSSWAKAGVMLRQSTDPGSPYYAALVTPGNGIVVQYRTSQGVNASHLLSITGTVPTYLKVTRSGSSYSTYTSSDGVTWTLVAGSTITLNMSGAVLAGLAVSSHNVGTLSTVTFDTVSTT